MSLLVFLSFRFNFCLSFFRVVDGCARGMRRECSCWCCVCVTSHLGERSRARELICIEFLCHGNKKHWLNLINYFALFFQCFFRFFLLFFFYSPLGDFHFSFRSSLFKNARREQRAHICATYAMQFECWGPWNILFFLFFYFFFRELLWCDERVILHTMGIE